MARGLNVIIVDDDEILCKMLSRNIESFYSWGKVISFSKFDEAMSYCLNCKVGLAVFVVDVFLDGKSGFYFLDSIREIFPSAHHDAIIITGNASDDIVDMCVASEVNYLLEKPVKPYAMQLAVRSIVSKYLSFSKLLMTDTNFAESVASIEQVWTHEKQEAKL